MFSLHGWKGWGCSCTFLKIMTWCIWKCCACTLTRKHAVMYISVAEHMALIIKLEHSPEQNPCYFPLSPYLYGVLMYFWKVKINSTYLHWSWVELPLCEYLPCTHMRKKGYVIGASVHLYMLNLGKGTTLDHLSFCNTSHYSWPPLKNFNSLTFFVAPEETSFLPLHLDQIWANVSLWK